MSWKEQGGDYRSATTMSKFNDAGQYMYHRVLVRVGAAGSTTLVPEAVRVASSTGEFAEREVKTWVGGGLPPHADDYLTGFHTHYMDPVEVYERINALAEEFPEIAEIIDLPHLTDGYQRKAMAVMAGTTGTGSTPSNTSQAVVLISKAWGHEGGNDVQAEFAQGVEVNAAPAVSVTGTRITVTLGVPGNTA